MAEVVSDVRSRRTIPGKQGIRRFKQKLGKILLLRTHVFGFSRLHLLRFIYQLLFPVLFRNPRN